MTTFAYTIEHDLGFAPNPFHGYCTLGCCKPKIRKKAQEGDIILGLGAVKPKLRGHLCYWMRVDEILLFDEYWEDKRFRQKKPIMNGTTSLQYGDNIYHRGADGVYRQEYSFHSLENGEISRGDLRRDTGTTEKVLISRTFGYWGRSGIKLPDDLGCFAISGPGHKSKFDVDQIASLMTWLSTLPCGFHDEPAHWQFLEKKKRVKKNKGAEQ